MLYAYLIDALPCYTFIINHLRPHPSLITTYSSSDSCCRAIPSDKLPLNLSSSLSLRLLSRDRLLLLLLRSRDLLLSNRLKYEPKIYITDISFSFPDTPISFKISFSDDSLCQQVKILNLNISIIHFYLRNVKSSFFQLRTNIWIIRPTLCQMTYALGISCLACHLSIVYHHHRAYGGHHPPRSVASSLLQSVVPP